MELEARGAKVVPVFAGGLDFSGPVNKYFYDPINTSTSFVDAVVSLTGFALVGGPARQDAPKAVTALSKLNVPYLCSLPLVFQTTNEWLDSQLGVHPVQVALQVLCQHSPLRLIVHATGLALLFVHPAIHTMQQCTVTQHTSHMLWIARVVEFSRASAADV
jgi:hypothetical protein